jgi:hypothetical protein
MIFSCFWIPAAHAKASCAGECVKVVKEHVRYREANQFEHLLPDQEVIDAMMQVRIKLVRHDGHIFVGKLI